MSFKIKQALAFIAVLLGFAARGQTLSAEQTNAMWYGSNYLAAPTITNMNGGLFNMKSVSVKVDLGSAVQDIVSSEAVKNKLELTLRRNGVKISDTSTDQLQFGITGIWDKNKQLFFHTRKLRMFRGCVIESEKEMRSLNAVVWESDGLSGAGGAAARQSVINGVESIAEEFSNAFLEANPK